MKISRRQEQVIALIWRDGGEEGVTLDQILNELRVSRPTAMPTLRSLLESPYDFLEKERGQFRGTASVWDVASLSGPHELRAVAMRMEEFQSRRVPRRDPDRWKLTERGIEAATRISDIRAAQRGLVSV